MEWISVKDRLPPVLENVLVSDGHMVCTAWMTWEYKWYSQDCLFFGGKQPSHWMPLPKPPKVKL